MDTAPETFYSIRDVQRLFGVCRATVYTWMRRDGLPSVKMGGALRFSKTRIDEWAEARCRPAKRKGATS